MSEDIVTRLRDMARYPWYATTSERFREAADEIERLLGHIDQMADLIDDANARGDAWRDKFNADTDVIHTHAHHLVQAVDALRDAGINLAGTSELVQGIEQLAAQRDETQYILEDVVNQACSAGETLDSMAYGAYSDAMTWLEQRGRITIERTYGRRNMANPMTATAPTTWQCPICGQTVRTIHIVPHGPPMCSHKGTLRSGATRRAMVVVDSGGQE